ncbi:MAG: acyl carrier protein [Candidatus Omnitrophota bacterium]|nr:MAG: acyl carrier protein [Candidatus Omnitrophota bacterium]
MEKGIKKVMSAVFGIDESAIDEATSPDIIETWDSLRHMTLIIALEEEFSIQFDDAEIAEMINLQRIRTAIEKKVSNI